MVAYAFNISTPEAEAGRGKFETNLVYKSDTRTARTVTREIYLEKNHTHTHTHKKRKKIAVS